MMGENGRGAIVRLLKQKEAPTRPHISLIRLTPAKEKTKQLVRIDSISKNDYLSRYCCFSLTLGWGAATFAVD